MKMTHPDHPLWGILRALVVGGLLLGVMAIFAQEFNANEWVTAAIGVLVVFANQMISWGFGKKQEQEFNQLVQKAKQKAHLQGDEDTVRFLEDRWNASE